MQKTLNLSPSNSMIFVYYSVLWAHIIIWHTQISIDMIGLHGWLGGPSHPPSLPSPQPVPWPRWLFIPSTILHSCCFHAPLCIFGVLRPHLTIIGKRSEHDILTQIQHIELNDQLTEKMKEVTAKATDEEGRADDLDRELKSLQNKYSDLEGNVIV